LIQQSFGDNSFYQKVNTLRSGISCRKSVCLSSVVCNVRASYSGGSNFSQCF